MSSGRLKCLSRFSAYLHLVLSFIGIAVVIATIVVVAKNNFDAVEDYEVTKYLMLGYLSCVLVYLLLLFSFSITLIVGIEKNKPKLLSPFVYLTYIGCWLYGLVALRHFISGLFNRGPFLPLFLHLLIHLTIIGILVAMLWPVLKLHKRWRKERKISMSTVCNNSTTNF
ncbi:uncharacterized protein LOC105261429 isoform X1 [Musca domestica]|uniref:Uncharacterized protein LOC105261429 isoform X1 n=1 Tax=Musca domestica TaxID=7370 RepID=A0ABM3USX8_MUSDO|nr:uncharacterized protein LOC105261429 isoform X1 [Musca domestica]